MKKLSRFIPVAGLLGGLLAGPAILRAATAPFADGTRQVALGDSITHRGTYVMNLQLFALTRYPDRSIDFFNAGVAGDTAAGGLLRVRWDVLSSKPNAVSVMFGMNDVGRDLYDPDLDANQQEEKRRRRIESFDTNLRDLVKTLKAGQVAVTLITPSPYDDTSTMTAKNFRGTDSQGLAECTRRVFQIAKEFDLPVVDLHTPMLAINREVQKKDPAATIIGKDRVHPGTPGHLVMAWLYLKSQATLGGIAQVVLDGGDGKVVEAANCTVDEVQIAPGSVRFRYLAKALPFPIEDAARPALDWAPINDDLNREILKIEGLPPGDYRLAIDDQPIRVSTAAELAEGINLALEPRTPQNRQAQGILQSLKDYWQGVETLRDIVVVESATMGRDAPRPLTFDQVKPKLDERLATLGDQGSAAYHRRVAQVWLENKPKEEELKRQAAERLQKIRESARPLPQVVSLTRVSP